MKVVAINSSPSMGRGATALILDPFLEGMRGAGAEVELYYTERLEIGPCRGCFTCSITTPGECVQDDDMWALYPKLYGADVWVFASPLYVSGVNGPMKTLMDRMLIPMGEPRLVLRDGRCHHPIRGDVKRGKVVLVSNCGYWEPDNFDHLLAFMDAFCWHAERKFAGALLRPHGPALRPMIEGGAPVRDVLDAAREAGRQLAEGGEMSRGVLDAVSRELMPREKYI